MEVWASAALVTLNLNMCQNLNGLMDKFNAACERLLYTEKSTFIQESQSNEQRSGRTLTQRQLNISLLQGEVCLNSLPPESLKGVNLEVSLVVKQRLYWYIVRSSLRLWVRSSNVIFMAWLDACCGAEWSCCCLLEEAEALNDSKPSLRAGSSFI